MRPFAIVPLLLALSPNVTRANAPPMPAQALPPRIDPSSSELAPLCPTLPASVASHKFAIGERLRFHLDLYGADVGSFEVDLEPPPREERAHVQLLIHARAHTSAFVSTNLGDYSGFALARIGPGLLPLTTHEEVDEGSTHWLHEATFPPRQGKLEVHASKNGEPAPLSLSATPSARDLLSAFLTLRAAPLTAGTQLCAEAFGGRRMWKMTGTIGPHELLETPLGKFDTVRIDLLSVRTDEPRTTRAAHFWITADERRLPIAALAEIKGKTIRAQLESASGHGWSLGKKTN
jgi:hypothetical protein